MTDSTLDRTQPNAADALKYAAALLRQRADWTTDLIGGSGCNVDHETSLAAIEATSDEISALATQFGDPRRYSDGRLVKSAREIEPGLVTEHVWHPDPSAEPATSWRGALRHDPDEPSPGIFEVTLDPAAQVIHVRTVRLA